VDHQAIRPWVAGCSHGVGCKVGRRHPGILGTRDSEGVGGMGVSAKARGCVQERRYHRGQAGGKFEREFYGFC
jgi:hypothetical protein